VKLIEMINILKVPNKDKQKLCIQQHTQNKKSMIAENHKEKKGLEKICVKA